MMTANVIFCGLVSRKLARKLLSLLFIFYLKFILKGIKIRQAFQ